METSHLLDFTQTESPVPKSTSPGAPSGSSTSNINGDMYIADGDYIKDIEVNDLRNRYTLTKGSTQKMVNTPIMSTDVPRLAYIYNIATELCPFELYFNHNCGRLLKAYDWLI